MTDTFFLLTSDSFKKTGLEIDREKVEKLYDYYLMLIEGNKMMNLTAITEERDVIIKHFTDSVSIVKSESFNVSRETKSLIDIGTGAGFPGMVLKICFPELNITLTDSLNKRLNFLKDVSAKLNIEINIIHGRAEDLGHKKEFREKFDYAVSRAVAELRVLCEYDLPFVKRGGVMIAYKGEGCDDEIKNAQNAISLLGGKFENKISFVLPDDYKRSLIEIKKIRQTGNLYPRKAGTPSRNPL